MNCHRRLLFASILLLAPLTAAAQVTPVIFERSAIRITAAPPSAKDTAPKPGHAPLTFSIEVRPEDALRLEYIHTLNNLTDSTGVMIAFTAPSMVALPMMKVYTPVDALFVTDNGTVTQILPNVVLGDLNQDVLAHAPVKAFLFLKAGTVAASGIRPRDIITGSMFAAAPPVME